MKRIIANDIRIRLPMRPAYFEDWFRARQTTTRATFVCTMVGRAISQAL